MHIHHVKHTGANIQYYEQMLLNLKALGHKVTISFLNEYEQKGNIHADVLTYQTFPDEGKPTKFNPKLVKKTDRLFCEFAGKKVLVDVHDNGNKDAYTRFLPTVPRVKAFPSYDYMAKGFNVLVTTGVSISPLPHAYDLHNRKVLINFKMGKTDRQFYHHRIREDIARQIDILPKHIWLQIDQQWENDREAFAKSIGRSLICIGAPGWGQYSSSYQLSLRQGTLLFAHKCLDDIAYLPLTKLVPGAHYITYDTFNFSDKLIDTISMDPEELDQIRFAGREIWEEGHNPKKSAEIFIRKLEEL